jgi:hypothetical protein
LPRQSRFRGVNAPTEVEFSLKINKSHAFQWVTWLRSEHRREFDRPLRHGTPSDWLVEEAKFAKLLTNRHNGNVVWVTFPLSLSRRSGQRLLYDTARAVDGYVRSIPVLAWRTLAEVRVLASARRTAEARRNAELAAEAVLHRAAVEFTHSALRLQHHPTVGRQSARGDAEPDRDPYRTPVLERASRLAILRSGVGYQRQPQARYEDHHQPQRCSGCPTESRSTPSPSGAYCYF